MVGEVKERKKTIGKSNKQTVIFMVVQKNKMMMMMMT